MINGFPKCNNYKVIVQCCTYNQSQYIEDTLKGFSLQQTNFPFVCCVFDDASTDGEQEILKRWIADHCIPEDVKSYDHQLCVILISCDKDNRNCIYAIHLQKVNTWGCDIKKEMLTFWYKQSKYIALCEGDDYWIDPLKLQKQVDILDKCLDVGLVYTEINRYFQCSNIIEKEFLQTKPIKNIHLDFVLNSWFLAPCTWMWRSELQEKIPNIDSKRFFDGDTLLLLSFSKYSRVYFLNEVTAVYRVLRNSASHFDEMDNRLLFERKNKNTRMLFALGLPLRFRFIFWWKIFYKERISFKLGYKYILTWLYEGIKDLVRIIFKIM